MGFTNRHSSTTIPRLNFLDGLEGEASTPIFSVRSCAVRSDLKDKRKISRKCLILKIRSYNARSDLKTKSVRFSGN